MENLKEFYTIEELSTIFECSTRTIQRNIKAMCDNLSQNTKNKKIPLNIAVEIARLNDWEFIKQKGGHDVVEEYYFTESEYNEFTKRLEEHPHLKDKIDFLSKHEEMLLKELEYHKKASEKHQQEVIKIRDTYFKHIEKFFNTMEQRNYLEAKNLELK